LKKLNVDELIKGMEEYIEKIYQSQIPKENSIRVLYEAGIVSKKGKLKPEFRNQ
jgi:hypothetical protein